MNVVPSDQGPSTPIPQSAPTRTVMEPAPRGGRVPSATRRTILRWGFWTSIGALFTGGIASLVNALYPRTVEAFGGPVTVDAGAIPKAGAPPQQNIDGHFLLVNLEPDEGRIAGDTEESRGGLLALWWKCPHLGCTVPWKGDYRAGSEKDPLDRKGWFNCNCHGSTYTKAGVKVFGPAPHSMDTMAIDVNNDGSITVQTGDRKSGDIDNPRRAVPWT
jgi:cytochrome b6-f complex iron-sulfur subunit